MASDSEAKNRWDRENTVTVTIKFQRKSDTDIIDYLESASGNSTKQSIIKEAVRYYMKNHKGGKK